MMIKTLIKQYGIKLLILRFLESRKTAAISKDYMEHFDEYFPSNEELELQRESTFSYSPLISIVVPTYETPVAFLKELIESILSQTYSNYELVLADGSTTDIVQKTASEYSDSRIRVISLKENIGISGNTNEGFRNANGDYIALLDHDDLLTPNALYEMVSALNQGETRPDVVYSNEDKLNMVTMKYADPAFKPDYNEYFLRHSNYICHFVIFNKKLLEQVKGLDSRFDGAQDHEFLLKCRAAGANFKHVNKILYHWRMHPASTAVDPTSKLYAYINGERAIEKHLNEIGQPGKVTKTPDLGIYRIDYTLEQTFSIIVFVRSEKQKKSFKKHQLDHPNLKITYEVVDSLPTDYSCYNYDRVVILEPNAFPKSNNWILELLKISQHDDVDIVTTKCITRNRIVSCGAAIDENGNISPYFVGYYYKYHGVNHRADDIVINVEADPMYAAMINPHSSSNRIVTCTYVLTQIR